MTHPTIIFPRHRRAAARRTERAYHHGDLRNGLLEAARAILEEQDLTALDLKGGGPAGGRQPRRALPAFSQSRGLAGRTGSGRLRRTPPVHRRGRQGRRAGIRTHRQYRRRLYALCRQAAGGGAADVRPPASQPRKISRLGRGGRRHRRGNRRGAVTIPIWAWRCGRRCMAWPCWCWKM